MHNCKILLPPLMESPEPNWQCAAEGISYSAFKL